MTEERIVLPIGTKLDWQYAEKRPGEIQFLHNGKPFDGFLLSTWGNQEKYSKLQYIRGFREGLTYTFNNEDLMLEAGGTYYQVEHGRWRTYDQDGRLKQEQYNFLQFKVQEKIYPVDQEPYIYYDIKNVPERNIEFENFLKQHKSFPLPSIHLPLEEAFAWFEENDVIDHPLLPGEFEAAQKAGYLFVSPDIRESLGFWKPS